MHGAELLGIEGIRVMVIGEEAFPNLQSLTFHFIGQNGAPFSVEIPPQGQVLPPYIATPLGVLKGYLEVAVFASLGLTFDIHNPATLRDM